MKIMKFGGSSVQDAAHIRKVCSIVLKEQEKGPAALVLSAMKGVTDLLIQASQQAQAGNPEYLRTITAIEEKELLTVRDLIRENTTQKETEQRVLSMTEEIRNLLHGVELVKECSPRSLDLIMSFGERLNAAVVTEYLNQEKLTARYIDARPWVLTDQQHGKASVNLPETRSRISAGLVGETLLPVITGFIASTEEGITTTLGRNGSDYSASLFGSALQAESVEIWTDVDGVYSADPRIVPSAFVIPELSIEEAMELSYFGAKVIHPYTLLPTVEKGIPIIIKNTLNPAAPGTRIWNRAARKPHPITGIASVEDVSLLNIVGGGMVGVPGMASRVFQALGKAGVNVIMISQASSEHSICIVCKTGEARDAKEKLEKELNEDLLSRRILRIDSQDDLEIVAVIGENMNGTPGISGRLFSSLGEKGINILAIAQGSSERNISFVLHRKDRDKAVNTVHKAFL